MQPFTWGLDAEVEEPYSFPLRNFGSENNETNLKNLRY